MGDYDKNPFDVLMNDVYSREDYIIEPPITPEGAQAKRMLSDLDTPADAPTEWEQNFLDSISHSLEKWGHLTDKQMAVLRKIHARIG